jgi:phosphohistidine phosphatase
VLRHAKATSNSPDGTDHSRPLTKRGRAQAALAAQFLTSVRAGGAQVPQLVICSSAVRAVQTAELVLSGLGPVVTLDVEPELYGADPKQMVARLQRVGDHTGSVMVVGHNPTFAELVVLLLAEDDSRDRVESFPTCALAQIDVAVGSWSELTTGRGHLERMFVP